MKRILLFIMAFSVIVCSGCQTESYDHLLEKYSVRICGNEEALNYLDKTSVYTEWDGLSYQDPLQVQTKTIELFGKSYDLEYENSRIQDSSYGREHLYISTDNDWFTVNDEGVLVACFLKNTSDVSASKSETECRQAAVDFIFNATGVSIGEEYREEIEYDEEDNEYKFSFVKYIGSLQTQDRAYVWVTEDGKIVGFRFCLFGKINANNVPEFNLNEAEKAVIAKLNILTEPAKKKFNKTHYSDTSVRITMIEPERYVLLYSVSIKFVKYEFLGRYEMGESATLIVEMRE